MNASEVPDEDIDLVVRRTGVSRERARQALAAVDGTFVEAVLRIESGDGDASAGGTRPRDDGESDDRSWDAADIPPVCPHCRNEIPDWWTGAYCPHDGSRLV